MVDPYHTRNNPEQAGSRETLDEALRRRAEAVEALLNELLSPDDAPAQRLHDAMRYAVLGPGKRLRPFLVLESAGLFGVAESQALRTAAAVECMHCYSLIHDDLPAMDDDPVRRGMPACHVAFDEATAILAGDSLQALAFEILADPLTHPDASVRTSLIAGLARAAGAHGMAGGQMLDISGPSDVAPEMRYVIALQEMKTGALISFAVAAGGLLGAASTDEMTRLHEYSRKIGLAFQIVDDILDNSVAPEGMDGPNPAGAGRGKGTFIDILGLEGAQAHAGALAAEAANALAVFGNRARRLQQAAQFIVKRQH